jgi:hypothetical protein
MDKGGHHIQANTVFNIRGVSESRETEKSGHGSRGARDQERLLAKVSSKLPDETRPKIEVDLLPSSSDWQINYTMVQNRAKNE